MTRLRTLKPLIRTIDAGKASVTTATATQRTRGSAWMATRERILRRAGGQCQCERCRASGDVRIATQVDHIVPLFAGGRDDDSNLQAINVECHRVKTDAEAARRASGG